MNFTLTRNQFRSDGIFGELRDSAGTLVAVTLEHAYSNGNGGWVPKVAAGSYNCARHAPNRLPYETFEVTNVPQFQGKPVTGILLHKGNFDKDSEGCILLGERCADCDSGEMITNSKVTFEKFMALLEGHDSFTLTIQDSAN